MWLSTVGSSWREIFFVDHIVPAACTGTRAKTRGYFCFFPSASKHTVISDRSLFMYNWDFLGLAHTDYSVIAPSAKALENNLQCGYSLKKSGIKA